MLGREDLNIEGRLTLRMYSDDGRLVEERVASNDITAAGRNLVARLFGGKDGDKVARVTMIHLGRSKQPFDAGQTGLADDAGTTLITQRQVSQRADQTGKLHAVLTLYGELEVGDLKGQALQEAGLFTEDTPPVMYNRVTFDTITKSDQFKLTLVWEIQF